jgi:hypothetical protein
MVSLAPPPALPPNCFLCGQPSNRCTTRSSNRNGNAGRPYFKCLNCDKFLAFADYRGNDPTNPTCVCGVSSKRQIAGRQGRVPGGVHYVCRLGSCDFYLPATNTQEQQIVVQEELVPLLARLSMIWCSRVCHVAEDMLMYEGRTFF